MRGHEAEGMEVGGVVDIEKAEKKDRWMYDDAANDGTIKSWKEQ